MEQKTTTPSFASKSKLGRVIEAHVIGIKNMPIAIAAAFYSILGKEPKVNKLIAKFAPRGQHVFVWQAVN